MESSGSGDLYAILGVDPKADGKAVKRAYFALIRTHTPEDSPEAFQRISEAYRILADPARRAEYDGGSRLPRDVEARLAALAALPESDPMAIRREAAALHRQFGRFEPVAIGIALAYLRIEQAPAAVTRLEEARAIHPASAEIHQWLGFALSKAGETDKAIDALKEAIALSPDRPEPYQFLARVLTGANRREEAIDLLARAIAADGVLDARDVPLVMERIQVLGVDRRWAEMERQASALIHALGTEPPEVRQFVAASFMGHGREFANANMSHFAVFFLDAARRLDPALPDVSPELRAYATAYREAELASKADDVPEWIKALIASAYDPAVKPEGVDSVLQGVGRYIATRSSLGAARKQWKQFKGNYPAVADAIGDRYLHVHGLAARTTSAASAARSESAARSIWNVMIFVFILSMALRACAHG